MMDQLIAIKDKLLAFWNKYTTKQKTIIICVVLAVFFAIRDIVLCVDEAGIYASGFFFRCQSGKYIIRFPGQ